MIDGKKDQLPVTGADLFYQDFMQVFTLGERVRAL